MNDKRSCNALSTPCVSGPRTMGSARPPRVYVTGGSGSVAGEVTAQLCRRERSRKGKRQLLEAAVESAGPPIPPPAQLLPTALEEEPGGWGAGEGTRRARQSLGLRTDGPSADTRAFPHALVNTHRRPARPNSHNPFCRRKTRPTGVSYLYKSPTSSLDLTSDASGAVTSVPAPPSACIWYSP